LLEQLRLTPTIVPDIKEIAWAILSMANRIPGPDSFEQNFA